jgi:hypothetical protein
MLEAVLITAGSIVAIAYIGCGIAIYRSGFITLLEAVIWPITLIFPPAD